MTDNTPSGCDARCWTPVTCVVCGRPFSPVGRSVGLEAASGFCDPYEPCDPAQTEQRRVHLFDEHDPNREITDPRGWAQHVAGCPECSANR